jgi:hypothetical protein
MTEDDNDGVQSRLPDPRDLTLEFVGRGVALVAIVAVLLFMMLALPSWMTYGVVFGLMLIPLLSYMGVGYSLGGALGGICWRVSTLASGGHVLEYQANGNYERLNWGEVDDPPENVMRLWNAPFGITYERDPDVFGEHFRETPVEVKTADGVILGNLERAGTKGYIDADQDEGEFWVQTPAIADLRFTSQKETTDEARDHAIEEYGGNTAQMANKTFAFMVMSCFVIGIVVGLFFA